MTRRARVVAAMAAVVITCVPGCGPGFAEVLVVGHDANGTPVVGAVDCSFDDRIAAESVTVSTAGREIWRVERPGRGLRPPEIGPPAPPPPEPRFVGGVEMIAIGDPLPSGGDATVALAEPLPDEIEVEASVLVDDLSPIAEVTLDRSGRPDTYQVAFRDGSVIGDLDAVGAAEHVRDGCDDDGFDLDGGVLAVVLGIGAVLLVLAAAPVIVLTVRQWRRAGTAAAEAEARRRAGP